MYLIARPSGPPLYPPSPLYLYLSERGRRGGAGGGGGGGEGAVPPGSWGRWRSVTDGAESQNSQPRAKFIPQNFPQGAQIYLIREMWREGCVFQCVCVCVCVCVLGSKYVQRKLRKPGRLSWLTQSPSASNLWRPQPPPPPLHRHTHTHSTLSKRPRKKNETQIDTDLMMATHVASFAYLQMHWESYFETDTHTQKETIKDRPYVSHMWCYIEFPVEIVRVFF